MGKKLLNLTAGVVTAAVSAAAMAPSAFAYWGQDNEVTVIEPINGTVDVDISHHEWEADTPGIATLTITPAEDYACESVSASYTHKGTNYNIDGLECGEEVTFELPSFWIKPYYPDVTVEVKFALANYYIITEDPEWTVGSEEGLEIVGNGAYDDFYRVVVDGVELGRDLQYEVAEGSTVVTLDPAYLSTLRDGAHTFAIEWNEGENSAATTFNIVTETPAPTPEEPEEEKAEEEKKVAPDTGVTSAIAFAGIAAALTLGGAIVSLKAKKNA